MAQFKELLEKEELKHMKEVKEDIKEENSEKNRSSEKAFVEEEPTGNVSMKENSGKGKGSKTWLWVAAIIAAIVIFK